MRNLIIILFTGVLFFASCKKRFTGPITVSGKIYDDVTMQPIPESEIFLVKKSSDINNPLRGETINYVVSKDGTYSFEFEKESDFYYEIHSSVPNNGLYIRSSPISYPKQIDIPAFGNKTAVDIPYTPTSWLKVNVIRDFSEPDYSTIIMLGHHKESVKENFSWKIPSASTTIKDIKATILSSPWAVPRLTKVIFQQDLDMPRHDTLEITIRF
jgi:hypothetical protein